MRLPRLLVALLPTASLAVAQQRPLEPSTTSTTLVDLLSADPDYTSLLSLLQRARLIPTLNKLNGSTLFAPTNTAIERYGLWSEDNINEQLRQQLLYHLLNFTLSELPPAGDPDGNEPRPQQFPTLHLPGPPPTKPPPWVPQPGIGTLGGEAQRLRVAHTRVAVDSKGANGIRIAKDPVYGTRDALVGIDGVIDVPKDLAHVIRHNPSLSYLSSILPDQLMTYFKETPALTLFLPQDDAWSTLHPIERLYLESEFALEDMRWILGMHSASESAVGWSDTFGEGRKLKTIAGSELDIVVHSGGPITVSGAPLLESDIYASNGVVHTVESLLLPPGSLKLTAEKYLLALNCTKFISFLRSADLSFLVNSTDSEPITILAPRDDVLPDSTAFLPDKGTEELRKALRYHFLRGKWTKKRLHDGMLLPTELFEEGLSGGRQVLGVTVDNEITFGGASILSEPIEINHTLIYLLSRPLIPPTDALSTILTNTHLSTFLASIFATSLDSTLRTLPNTTLLLPSNDAFTALGLVTSYLLLPNPPARADLANVIKHHVVQHVVYTKELNGGADSGSSYVTLEGSDVKLASQDDGLGGSNVRIDSSGGWNGVYALVVPLDSSADRDMLTNTGVMHEVDDILLPRTVQLTIGKLISAARGGTMASLVVRAGMEWVLNGQGPPESETGEGGEWEGWDRQAGWTLLVPTDEAFKGVNLTELWADVPRLRKIVSQHLIPTVPSTSKSSSLLKTRETDKDKQRREKEQRDHAKWPIDMDNAAVHATANSKDSSYGDVVFLREEDAYDKDEGGRRGGKGTGYVVGIKGARGGDAKVDWARVLAWGRSTPPPSDLASLAAPDKGKTSPPRAVHRGGIVQIDRLLVPFEPPWYIRYGRPAALLVSGVLAIALFFWFVRWVWTRKDDEATYEPVGIIAEEEEE